MQVFSRNSVRFPLVGALFVCIGLQYPPAGWLLVWLGISFLCVGYAYASSNPRLFGKLEDGRLAWWTWTAFGPHLLIAWLSWQGSRLLGREPCFNEIAPGIFLGRRPYARELPAGVGLIVDLTSEFPAAPGIADGKTYWCVPMLDGSAAEPRAFDELVRKIADWKSSGVYIHCALGHGRSAMVAAAVLLQKGMFQRVEEAVAAIRRIRPGVRLNKSQLELITSFAQKVGK